MPFILVPIDVYITSTNSVLSNVFFFFAYLRAICLLAICHRSPSHSNLRFFIMLAMESSARKYHTMPLLTFRCILRLLYLTADCWHLRLLLFDSVLRSLFWCQNRSVIASAQEENRIYLFFRLQSVVRTRQMLVKRDALSISIDALTEYFFDCVI